jgi:hypothetical protein
MSDEAHRHAAEVRWWWKELGGNPALIKEMLARVARRRSPAAVAKLRDGLLEMHNERKRNG